MATAAATSPDRLAAELARGALDAGGLLVCTDFDGSLAPIVRRPEEARPLPQAARAVAWLSRRGAREGVGARCPVGVAVVSGRDSDDVARRLGLGPEGVAVGNLGLERWTEGRVELEPGVETWLPAVAAAACDLEAALAAGRLPGARLERKRCATVVHTRGLGSAGAEPEALELAGEVAGRRGLRVVAGKRAAEIRVPLDLDKGSAVAAIRARSWPTVFLCAAGDDLGDVPMLRVASAGGRGVAVVVTDAEVPPEILGMAAHTVDGPWAWAQALDLLVERLRRRDLPG